MNSMNLDPQTIVVLINAGIVVEQQLVNWIKSERAKAGITDDQEFDAAKLKDADTHGRVKALLGLLPAAA